MIVSSQRNRVEGGEVGYPRGFNLKVLILENYVRATISTNNSKASPVSLSSILSCIVTITETLREMVRRFVRFWARFITIYSRFSRRNKQTQSCKLAVPQERTRAGFRGWPPGPRSMAANLEGGKFCNFFFKM